LGGRSTSAAALLVMDATIQVERIHKRVERLSEWPHPDDPDAALINEFAVRLSELRDLILEHIGGAVPLSEVCAGAHLPTSNRVDGALQ